MTTDAGASQVAVAVVVVTALGTSRRGGGVNPSSRNSRRSNGRQFVAAVVVGAIVSACSADHPSKVNAATSTAPSTVTSPVTSTDASSSTVTSSSSSAAPSRYATLYLQILGPADQASGTFFTALKALPKSATGADGERIATPAADAIDTADQQLRQVSWPRGVAPAINALVLVDTRLVGALRDLATLRYVTSGSWKSRFEQDVSAVSARVAIVVADLQQPVATK